MARKETAATSETEQRAKPGDNGFDPEKSQNLVERIINLHTELETESGRIRGEIKTVYAQAKGLGIPKELLKEIVGEIRGEDKKKKRQDELDVDYPGQLEKLRKAIKGIEDLPLGRAAIENAGPPGPKPKDSWNPTGAETPPQE